MASSLLEAQRSALEELDRIEQAISERITRNPAILPDNARLSTSSELHGRRKRPFKETVLQEQEVGRFVNRYREQCEFLKKSFTETGPEAAARKKELAELATTDDARVSLLDNFYRQANTIKEYHRRYPNQEVEDLHAQYQMGIVALRKQREMLESGVLTEGLELEEHPQAAAAEGSQQAAAVANLLAAESKGTAILLSSMAADLNLDALFSGEESYGKYLDLVAFHEQFTNLKLGSAPGTSAAEQRHALTYIQYLDIFSSFSHVELFPVARLRDETYFTYATELHQYIERFFRKTHILENTDKVVSKIEADFESTWTKKLPFPGWAFQAESTVARDGVETPEGFYCTPCGKYFAKETVYRAHLTGKKHIKNAKQLELVAGNSTKAAETENTEEQLRLKLLAMHEYCTYHLAQLLQKQIADTRNNVERRRALTDRERQLELAALEAADTALLAELDNPGGHGRENGNGDGNDSDSDSDDIVYNPLKLPLGHDGKPIPFWLWKLHGLGVQYPCEICGNYVYMGRMAFDKHFVEARHVHGLRCLGITPGLLFKGVVSIADAMALWEKIKRENRQEESHRENAIEMEDDEGNVMSEKVYNDLKKQGLL